MNYTNVLSTVILSSAIFLSSCGKDEDTTPPVINLERAIEATYSVGDTVFIQASITDDVEMHEVHVHIYKKPAMEEVYHLDRHSHSNPVTIESFYVIPAGGEGEYELEIHAKDDADNESETKRDFTVN